MLPPGRKEYCDVYRKKPISIHGAPEHQTGRLAAGDCGCRDRDNAAGRVAGPWPARQPRELESSGFPVEPEQSEFRSVSLAADVAQTLCSKSQRADPIAVVRLRAEAERLKRSYDEPFVQRAEVRSYESPLLNEREFIFSRLRQPLQHANPAIVSARRSERVDLIGPFKSADKPEQIDCDDPVAAVLLGAFRCRKLCRHDVRLPEPIFLDGCRMDESEPIGHDRLVAAVPFLFDVSVRREFHRCDDWFGTLRLAG